MRYWDTPAILALIVDDPTREKQLEQYEENPQIVAWWATPVEIASAIARREREGTVTAADADAALKAAKGLAAAWHEVVPGDAIRRTAERPLHVHVLRAADRLQLSAALIAANHDPTMLDMVCLDSRLTAAARREGFNVIGS